MKTIKQKIDRFVYEYPNFGIPNLMKYVVIAGGVFWILGMVYPRALSLVSFSPDHILHGQIWRIISFVFYPPDTSIIALIAFYFYYFIGSTLEQSWGTAKFNLYFLCGIVLTVIFGFAVFFIAKINIAVDSTFIYLSMFFAYAALYPENTVLLFFIIPIKMKYLALVDAAFFILNVFSLPFPANLLPVVAILNVVIFCGEEILGMFNLPQIGRKPKFTSATGNFRTTRKTTASYLRKCCVCGKTDTQYPELDFRYCSLCKGYHCFCEEHINSHIHFNE